MRHLDAFSAQLVDFVRRMPDDALLALVRAQLGGAVLGGPTLPQVRARVSAAAGAPVDGASSGDASPRAAASSRGAAAKTGRGRRGAAARGAAARGAGGARGAAAKRGGAAKGGARRGRGSAAGRQELLGVVERIVKTSSGVSASEVAKSANVPQSRASSALKELKLAKRIFQGGDRRFARYAGDAKTAQGASDSARKTASGPVSKRKR